MSTPDPFLPVPIKEEKAVWLARLTVGVLIIDKRHPGLKYMRTHRYTHGIDNREKIHTVRTHVIAPDARPDAHHRRITRQVMRMRRANP